MPRSSGELARAAGATALLLVAAAAAWAAEPQLQVRVDDRPVRVGDRLRVQVSAVGQGWTWGDLNVEEPAGGAWTVAGAPRALAGTDPPAWELELVPLAVGAQQLPGMSVAARSRTGRRVQARPAELPRVTVGSVLPQDEEAPEPAPLRDPVGVRGLAWEWMLPALLAGLPLVALLAWWSGARRGGGRAEGRALQPIEELETLARDLGERIGREPEAGCCDRLAAGLRRYLELRTGEPAQEMTSFELRRLGRRAGWPQGVQHAVGQVMQVADDVRFGQRQVAPAVLEAAVHAALAAGHQLEAHIRARQAAAEASQEEAS